MLPLLVYNLRSSTLLRQQVMCQWRSMPGIPRPPFRVEALLFTKTECSNEPGNVIANLELLPLKLNESKNSKIGDRQVSLAKRLHAASLLTDSGLAAVKSKS